MQANIYNIITTCLEDYLGPILNINSEEDLFVFLESIGWNIESAVGSNSSSLFSDVESIKALIDQIMDLINEEEYDLIPVISEIDNLLNAASNFKNGITGISGNILEEFASDIFNALLVIYLGNRQPLLMSILNILTIVRKNEVNFLVDNNNIIRSSNVLPYIYWQGFSDLVTDPKGLFRDFYWPNGFTSIQDVNEVAKRLFTPIQSLLNLCGFQTLLGRGIGPPEFSNDIENKIEGFLSFSKEFGILDSNSNVLGLTIGLIPESEGGPGILLMPFGITNLTEIISQWLFSIDLSAAAGGIIITENGLTLIEDLTQNSFNAELILAKLPNESGNGILIGNQNSSHFAIENIAIRGEIDFNSDLSSYSMYLILNQSKLVINGNDGDGFISKVVGDGFTTEFDLEIGYSNRSGFHFKGSAELETIIPSHISIGLIEIDDIALNLGLNDGFSSVASTSVKVELGPFQATIKGIGVSVTFNTNDEGGNVGQFDLNFGFKPPSGIGLTIDADVVKGGGYIELNPDNGEYFGVLELTVKETISIKAIGILNTVMPDGSKNFSLFLLITAEFTPIQLGFGFTLNGVGGLIGVNRTMVLEALREGVKTGAVDNIMFPDDPVNNAPQIISDLQNIFLPEEGRYTFGLMGILGWGTPNLIELEMGLILEVPSPVRLAILGVLRVVLPDKEKSLLKLQVNFAGTIDFEQKFITFDASLFDSRLLTWTLTGDMAVRIKGGDNANFVFTVGGFHPSYSPPSGLSLPALDRLTISLLPGNNPRLTIESYFAVTSNTVQFGARLDFYFKISGKIHVKGWMGFDALFQFSPFYFNVTFTAGLGVYRGNTSLLGISLTVDLEGPTPWRAKGTAEFKVLGFKKKVKFDKEWGRKEQEVLPDIAIIPLLENELRVDTNWRAIRVPGTISSVTLREIDTEDDSENTGDSTLILYPHDVLEFTQSKLPLNMILDKVGNQKPSDESKVDIKIFETVEEDGELVEKDLTGSEVKEQFAPGQFKDYSNAQKLSIPNFQKYRSGAQLAVDNYGNLSFDYLTEREVQYEKIVIDKKDPEPVIVEFLPLSDKLHKAFSGTNSITRNRNSFAARTPSVLAAKGIKIEEKLAVRNTLTGEILELPRQEGYASIEEQVSVFEAQNPAMEGFIEVVPAHELIS